MRVRVRLTALLAFLLLILSHQTFPKTYIPKANVSDECVKQNSAYCIGGKIKIRNSNK